ncbi:hypothetical protein Dimus_002274 [Dionaea muscipula]
MSLQKQLFLNFYHRRYLEHKQHHRLAHDPLYLDGCGSAAKTAGQLDGNAVVFKHTRHLTFKIMKTTLEFLGLRQDQARTGTFGHLHGRKPSIPSKMALGF